MSEQGDRFWRGLVAGMVVSSGVVGAALAAWHRLRSAPSEPPDQPPSEPRPDVKDEPETERLDG